MKYIAKGLISLLLTACALWATAQEKFATLTGKITDKQTHLPIPFASIQLTSGSTGTVTNIEGEFIFKIPERHLRDSVLISCVGYKTLKVALPSIGLNVSLALEPAVVQLHEVTIRRGTTEVK